MHDVISKATGSSIAKTAPMKSKSRETITDSRKQRDRWVEHYLELVSSHKEYTVC